MQVSASNEKNPTFSQSMGAQAASPRKGGQPQVPSRVSQIYETNSFEAMQPQSQQQF